MVDAKLANSKPNQKPKRAPPTMVRSAAPGKDSAAIVRYKTK